MATNVTRLTNVIEGYTGTASTGAQVNRIVARVLPLAQNQIAADGKITANLTNEEKAGYVLAIFKTSAQSILRGAAAQQEQASVQTTVDTNTTSAVADLQ